MFSILSTHFISPSALLWPRANICSYLINVHVLFTQHFFFYIFFPTWYSQCQHGKYCWLSCLLVETIFFQYLCNIGCDDNKTAPCRSSIYAQEQSMTYSHALTQINPKCAQRFNTSLYNIKWSLCSRLNDVKKKPFLTLITALIESHERGDQAVKTLWYS